MAAVTRFEDVINYISNSRLNFSSYKTPFSAQISLKNSFANYYKETDDVANAGCETNRNHDKIVMHKSELMELN